MNTAMFFTLTTAPTCNTKTKPPWQSLCSFITPSQFLIPTDPQASFHLHYMWQCIWGIKLFQYNTYDPEVWTGSEERGDLAHVVVVVKEQLLRKRPHHPSRPRGGDPGGQYQRRPMWQPQRASEQGVSQYVGWASLKSNEKYSSLFNMVRVQGSEVLICVSKRSLQLECGD